jgi:hypothetical protein
MDVFFDNVATFNSFLPKKNQWINGETQHGRQGKTSCAYFDSSDGPINGICILVPVVTRPAVPVTRCLHLVVSDEGPKQDCLVFTFIGH